MASTEPIWQQGRRDLMIRDERGNLHVLLWEHSARVARTAQQIARLPEIASCDADRTVLLAAGLYHDAGWVLQYRQGSFPCGDILCRNTSDLQRELGAALLEEKLAAILSPPSLEAAALCVRHMNERDPILPEAQILAEANELDQLGALLVWQAARRSQNDGRGIEAAIESWQRQKEYHYWEARVADAFRWDAVRDLARQRLACFARFMDELARQHKGIDITESIESLAGGIEEQVPTN